MNVIVDAGIEFCSYKWTSFLNNCIIVPKFLESNYRALVFVIFIYYFDMASSGSETASKSKNPHFSHQQNVVLIDMIIDSYDYLFGCRVKQTNFSRRKQIWQRISDAVSAQGPGKKDVDQLKKRYNDIKRFAKAKLAREKNSARATGGGPAYVADLNDYEQKLVQRLGPEIITGITDDCDSDLRAMPTTAEPVRSNEVPTCSTSSSAVSRPPSAAVSRPSASFTHGQLIRSSSNVTHTTSSADTLPDLRTSTPQTGVGRSTGDLGRLFQGLTGHSSPLFDEENSSREITINLMPIVENPIQDEPPGGHDGSETPDILEDLGDAQPDEIHTPENIEEPVETQAPPIELQTGGVNIDNTPAEGQLGDVALREMLTLARQYREDHREMQNIINTNIERWAALSEKNVEIERQRNEIEMQKLQLQREMFQWQRQMDEEKNHQINRALSISERTLQSLLAIVSEREATTDPKRPRLE
ncbi:uncharacterized protein LOC128655970 isoform X2 [Bombina bombina]|uniref:uncharacterized protein LOC128655970 isoform X2 n=1 Tax=Bombina bombina TaxID=8345 RepID=UPI00235B1FB6|nr:uncharacterized protein LOC128655970 isoform X2 [Bombina bombina]